MRDTFTARGAGAYLGPGLLECGLSGDDEAGEERYLTFRLGRDGRVYFEADRDGAGEWDCVQAVHVAQDQVSVDLIAPVPALGHVEGFDVSLDVDNADFETFCSGIRLVFEPTPIVVS